MASEARLTRYDYVLRPVHNLYAPVRMPDSEIPGPHASAGKDLLCRLGILVVPLGTDVAKEHNLANLLPVPLHVYQHRWVDLWLIIVLRARLDDADRQTGDEAVTLPGEF